MALNLSETGHLVLSTLHTLDAAETINRLVGFSLLTTSVRSGLSWRAYFVPRSPSA